MDLGFGTRRVGDRWQAWLLVAATIASMTLGPRAVARAQEVPLPGFDEETVDLVTTIGERALGRLRRAFALGPFVGLAPGMSFDDPGFDLRLSFGLALVHFSVPVLPSPDRIREIVHDRLREAVLQQVLVRRAQGQEPSEADLEQIAREAWAEIRAELLLEYRPRRFEKPSFSVLLEVERLFLAPAWEVGFTLGFGIGPVFLRAGPVLHIHSGVDLYTAVELSVPMLLGDGPASPVVEAFLRGDIATTGRDARADRAFLGVRFLLDII